MENTGARAPSPAPRGWHSRGYLPHLDCPGLVQAVTFRLADSLPDAVLLRLRDQGHGKPSPQSIALALDEGHGACLLGEPAHAARVQDVLLNRDGLDYRLLAWVIMPNHVHAVIETMAHCPLARVVGAWKSVTARRLGRGRIWQPDYFDRFVRDDRHLAAVIAYVEQNPVKAGLCLDPQGWMWGSARMRAGAPALR